MIKETWTTTIMGNPLCKTITKLKVVEVVFQGMGDKN